MEISMKPPNRLSVIVGKRTETNVHSVGERIVVGEIDPYEGAYDVTPKVGEEVTLPTKNLRMKDDVTVHEVPIFRTANTSGTTVYIGTEGLNGK